MAGSRRCRKAQPLQRSEMLAAFSVGTEIIQLRRIAGQMDLGSELDTALEAVGRGEIALATARLGRLDERSPPVRVPPLSARAAASLQ